VPFLPLEWVGKVLTLGTKIVPVPDPVIVPPAQPAMLAAIAPTNAVLMQPAAAQPVLPPQPSGAVPVPVGPVGNETLPSLAPQPVPQAAAPQPQGYGLMPGQLVGQGATLSPNGGFYQAYPGQPQPYGPPGQYPGQPQYAGQYPGQPQYAGQYPGQPQPQVLPGQGGAAAVAPGQPQVAYAGSPQAGGVYASATPGAYASASNPQQSVSVGNPAAIAPVAPYQG
jgi:hypothetical protein